MVPLTLVVLLAPAACSSDPTGTEEDDLLQALFGTWSWIQATGGISGTTRTPDSEGYTRTLTFTPPNQVEMLRDGAPYRRLWASERKHMPDIDVAAAGGWKDSRGIRN